MARRRTPKGIAEGYAAVQTATFWRMVGDWQEEHTALETAQKHFAEGRSTRATRLTREVDQLLKERIAAT